MKTVCLGVGLISLSLMLCGCMNANTTATAEEERAYRNPPKNPPPEAIEGMKNAMSQKH